MTLLLDENLPVKLVQLLSDCLDCTHVSVLDLLGSSDQDIWHFAVQNELVIVSKDSDFNDRALVSADAKVIWIRLGNCSTEAIHLVLRNSVARIETFLRSSNSVLIIP